MERLTKTEREVLGYIQQGVAGYKQIAAIRGVSTKAIQMACNNIMRKYNCRSMKEVLVKIHRESQSLADTAEYNHQEHLQHIKDTLDDASHEFYYRISQAVANPKYQRWRTPTIAFGCVGLLLFAGTFQGWELPAGMPISEAKETTPALPALSVSGSSNVLIVGSSGATVAPTVATVKPSVTPIGKYWISSVRDSRGKLHTAECRYHKMQTDTHGASRREYFESVEDALHKHPNAEMCQRCLREDEG